MNEKIQGWKIINEKNTRLEDYKWDEYKVGRLKMRRIQGWKIINEKNTRLEDYKWEEYKVGRL